MEFNDRFKYQGVIHSAGICKTKKKDWGYHDNEHIPDCLEIIYCLSGREEMLIDGELIEFLPGMLKIAPPATQIKQNIMLRTLEDSEFIDIGFITKNPFVTKTTVLDVRDNKKIQNLLDRLLKICQKYKSDMFFKASSVFYLLVEEICVMMEQDVDALKIIDEKLDPVTDFICNHYTEKHFSLTGLHGMCKMSKNQFYRTFQKRHGITPSAYLTNLRMQYSLELLNRGSFSISEIAEKTGYESVAYFSRVFKKSFGQSPSKYIK